LIIGLCDNFLTISEEKQQIKTNVHKFFSISSKLPMDVQMRLCNVINGIHKSYISVRDFETFIVKML